MRTYLEPATFGLDENSPWPCMTSLASKLDVSQTSLHSFVAGTCQSTQAGQPQQSRHAGRNLNLVPEKFLYLDFRHLNTIIYFFPHQIHQTLSVFPQVLFHFVLSYCIRAIHAWAQDFCGHMADQGSIEGGQNQAWICGTQNDVESLREDSIILPLKSLHRAEIGFLQWAKYASRAFAFIDLTFNKRVLPTKFCHQSLF